MAEEEVAAEPETASTLLASDVVTELIGDLAAEGTLINEGGFTLDPTKALEKLRAFQLAEREAWVLFLVEAASLAGAGARIAFWTGEDLTVDFDGPPLSVTQLESIFLAPFENTSELDSEALMVTELRRCLAMALNAALAIESRGLEVVTLDAEGQGQRLVLGPTGEARVELCEDAKPGIIRVRRLSQGMEGLHLSQRELDLVRTRCAHASFSISCDGARINRGVRAIVERGPHCPVTDAEGRAIGVATLDDEEGSGRVLIVVRGVLMETLSLREGWHNQFLVAVDVDLPTDLGSNQVRRGPGFDAVIAAIDAAHEELRALESAGWDDDALVRLEPELSYQLQVTNTGEFVATLTGAQLQDLLELLVREHEHDRDYYIDRAVLDWLAAEGADRELLAMLGAFVERHGPAELSWTVVPPSEA